MALFKYPHVKDIWTAYLKHFVDRCARPVCVYACVYSFLSMCLRVCARPYLHTCKLVPHTHTKMRMQLCVFEPLLCALGHVWMSHTHTHMCTQVRWQEAGART